MLSESVCPKGITLSGFHCTITGLPSKHDSMKPKPIHYDQQFKILPTTTHQKKLSIVTNKVTPQVTGFQFLLFLVCFLVLTIQAGKCN
jgi:hypothetical protein